MATLTAISALAGDVDVPISSSTVTRGWPPRASTTWSYRRQPRLPVDVVARGVPGAAVLLSGTRLGQVSLPPLPSHALAAAREWIQVASQAGS
ncbi:MAG TPA: hypothetical protein VEJ84_21630 [Acidimicrobiales bacterium]|nr:hypothetical protein [Acidimicrobiales bacterium]